MFFQQKKCCHTPTCPTVAWIKAASTQVCPVQAMPTGGIVKETFMTKPRRWGETFQGAWPGKSWAEDAFIQMTDRHVGVWCWTFQFLDLVHWAEAGSAQPAATLWATGWGWRTLEQHLQFSKAGLLLMFVALDQPNYFEWTVNAPRGMKKVHLHNFYQHSAPQHSVCLHMFVEVCYKAGVSILLVLWQWTTMTANKVLLNIHR